MYLPQKVAIYENGIKKVEYFFLENVAFFQNLTFLKKLVFFEKVGAVQKNLFRKSSSSIDILCR